MVQTFPKDSTCVDVKSRFYRDVRKATLRDKCEVVYSFWSEENTSKQVGILRLWSWQAKVAKLDRLLVLNAKQQRQHRDKMFAAELKAHMVRGDSAAVWKTLRDYAHINKSSKWPGTQPRIMDIKNKYRLSPCDGG